jgi:hypothetical protein
MNARDRPFRDSRYPAVPRLLRPERFHGIDVGGTPRGHVCRGPSHEQQHDRRTELDGSTALTPNRKACRSRVAASAPTRLSTSPSAAPDIALSTTARTTVECRTPSAVRRPISALCCATVQEVLHKADGRSSHERIGVTIGTPRSSGSRERTQRAMRPAELQCCVTFRRHWHLGRTKLARNHR